MIKFSNTRLTGPIYEATIGFNFYNVLDLMVEQLSRGNRVEGGGVICRPYGGKFAVHYPNEDGDESITTFTSAHSAIWKFLQTTRVGKIKITAFEKADEKEDE